MSEAGGDRRLRILRATRLVDVPAKPAFNRLTALAARLLRVPVALVSLVDDRRQFFHSAVGLSEPWASLRETPLTHSFCQHVVRNRSAVVVRDARVDPLFAGNPAIRDLGVVAYAGVPLVVEDEAIGALCAIDGHARDWTAEDVQLLEDLAASVVSEIDLGIALGMAEYRAALNDTLVESLGDAVLAVDCDRTFLVANAAARRLFSDGARVGLTLSTTWASDHGSVRPDGQPFLSEQGALARGLRGEDTDGVEFTRHVPGAPAPTWVEAKGRPVRGATGGVIAAVAVYRDVTERRSRADLYATLAANVPRSVVLLLDHDLRCVAIDGGLLRDFGADPSSLVGKPLHELARGAMLAAEVGTVEGLGRRTLEGASLVADVHASGRVLAVNTAPVRDTAGRITAAIVLAADVSDERRTAAALRERDAMYRDLLERLAIGVCIIRDGVIAYANASLVRMLGYDHASELVGRLAIESLAHPDDRPASAARLDASISMTEPPRRLRALRKDGSVVVVESSPRPFEHEGRRAVLSTMRDLSAEIEVEAARAQAFAAVEVFRIMVESLRDHAILQLDPKGLVRSWNPGARAIKGYETEEILGQSFAVFYAPRDRHLAGEALRVAAATGHHSLEGWRVRKDGSRFWASVTIAALHDPTSLALSGFVKVTRDLSERKRTEDARTRALAEKTALLQEVHHRVKNNLQMISSLLSLQARQVSDARLRAMFVDTQGRVRSIALLHESLYQHDDLGRVDMRAYVDTLVNAVQRSYGRGCASFATEVEPIDLGVDVAVPSGLIINELVTNALKHAFRDGQADREVRIGMRADGSDLVIEVADNGRGFAVEATTHESMGLTLVRDLSAQLGGVVEFVPGEGARCTVRFPAPARRGGQ